jgi:hypothetical protein
VDRSEEILEYISRNQGTTEHMVAVYMAENNICARETTHNVIYNSLIPLGKVKDRKKGNSFHKLYINNENEFIKLLNEIERLFEAVLKVKSFARNDLIKKDRVYRGIVELAHRLLYKRITHFAWKIRSDIESSDDREILYSNLVNILEESSELYRKTSDSFFEDLEVITDELHIQNNRKGRDKETVAMVNGIIETMIPFTSNLA